MLLLEVISGETLSKPDRGKMRFHKVSSCEKSVEGSFPASPFLDLNPFSFFADRQRKQSPRFYRVERCEISQHRC